ncbi:hypothetical protein POTOM_044303 [Populus tomentosa]|uniref:Uroporphyrinogen decarboxylase (URO-D) domain-containing protein n=1 Tax=Populus tomentosa TaxID=118781 RepID=A0A8X7YJ74_POPTO|nr:hypothetical protein POTOM_044303 [Populus tomentosa]
MCIDDALFSQFRRTKPCETCPMNMFPYNADMAVVDWQFILERLMRKKQTHFQTKYKTKLTHYLSQSSHILEADCGHCDSIPSRSPTNPSRQRIWRLALTGVDVVSMDWSVDMAEGRRRLGPDVAVQGNVDPGVLFGSKEFTANRINGGVRKAGKGKHTLNLGHGIAGGTPEENVALFLEVAKRIR